MLLILGCSSEYDHAVIPPPPPEPPEDTATPPEPHLIDAEQNYVQTYETGTMKVILYVDKSGSMNAEVPRVGEAALALAIALDLVGDWSISFSTTDQWAPDTFGPYTDLADADRIKSAPGNLRGGGMEAGLGAIYNGPRDPGTVHVVFSDEDDQSYPEPGFTSTQHPWMNNWFWTISEWASWWGTVPMESLIFVLPTSCQPAQHPLARWHEVAPLVGAPIYDLCVDDWAPWISAFKWPYTNPQTTYVLAHDPVPASVHVYYDGVEQGGYNLTGRTVTLWSPPPIGTPVDIEYKYWSL